MVKKVFAVTDMHCTNCAMKIEEIEDVLPGVKAAYASYQKMELRVEYDESRVSKDQVIAAVKARGYTAVPK